MPTHIYGAFCTGLTVLQQEMGTGHHGVTLAIMGHIIVTMGDIEWMG